VKRPHVLDGYHGLVGEGREQPDLFDPGTVRFWALATPTVPDLDSPQHRNHQQGCAVSGFAASPGSQTRGILP